MTLDQDEHCKTTARSRGTRSATAPGRAHDHDVWVSILLLLLLIAVALHIPISGEIGDTSADRHGFFAHAIDLIVNLGLSIGVSSLLLSRRPRDDRDEANR